MPWEIVTDHPECSGFAVVKEGENELEGCHRTREAAQRQLAALYAQEEDDMAERELDAGASIRRTFQATLEPSGDGRTLDLRIVPYNTVTRVRD